MPKNWGFIFFISCPCFPLLFTIGISSKNICMYHAFHSACFDQQVAPIRVYSILRRKLLCSSSPQSSADGLAVEHFICSESHIIQLSAAARQPGLSFCLTTLEFLGSILSFFNLSHYDNWFCCVLWVLYCVEQASWESRSHLAGVRKSGWTVWSAMWDGGLKNKAITNVIQKSYIGGSYH